MKIALASIPSILLSLAASGCGGDEATTNNEPITSADPSSSGPAGTNSSPDGVNPPPGGTPPGTGMVPPSSVTGPGPTGPQPQATPGDMTGGPGPGVTPPVGGTGGVDPGPQGTAGGAVVPVGGSGPVGGAGPVAGGGGGEAPVTPGGGGGPGPETDPTPPNLVVTSAQGDFWKVGEWTEASSGSPNVTVNDAMTAQTWEGFGGSFNELGWAVLTTPALQEEAIKLLFSATDGANLSWGRIPMGASDYGRERYTYSDTGEDVVAEPSEANRPPPDLALAGFTIERDQEMLIPYIQAAQALKDDIRFWASPWTPPVWMKTGYKMDSGGTGGGDAVRPSYYDGGSMKGDADTLAAYAQYFVKFVEAYRELGIDVEVVSPQNEPGYDQNYPSCLWDSQTYISFVGTHLGPAMEGLGVRVMLGTMSNAGDANRNDLDIVNAVMGDASASGYVTVGGAQWGVLGQVNGGASFGGLPVWATEHKCGNYPWNPSGYPTYNMSQAPNDMAYGVESWGYLRDAINDGGVTSYNAWNMVLDRYGLGNDESRHWGQNALLVSDSGTITPTPYYYVFRHLAQYTTPGATVISAGNDAVAFKNPNGSLVAVVYNSGQANPNYVVSIGGKNVTFAMPAAGWATVKVTP